MKPKRKAKRTQAEVQAEGFAALVERLGPADAIRFVQFYQNGEGDYTKERRELLKDETVSSLAKKIKALRRRRGEKGD